ncbi:hypothetical protein D3C86_1909000 [compost metagenome]
MPDREATKRPVASDERLVPVAPPFRVTVPDRSCAISGVTGGGSIAGVSVGTTGATKVVWNLNWLAPIDAIS